VSDARSSSAIATTGTADLARPYRGRFAPSPSGPLHFGSLIAAVGSYLEARTRGGEWLVRIEDLDPPRERPGAADAILATLEHLDLHWDGPVLRQSTRGDAYQAALDRLAATGRTFRCACSRAQLTALPQNLRRDPGDELFHPRVCPLSPAAAGTSTACRFRTRDGDVEFMDRVQGRQFANVARTVGDFVLRRRDGWYAYQLAVVVDDAAQGVTDVVRGADLLGSTARQILLQEALGLPRLTYMHLPLAVDESGLKLSKSDDAPALSRERPAAQLVAVLEFLRQGPPAGLGDASPGEVLQWARAHWRPGLFSGMTRGAASGASVQEATQEDRQ
jgi:glutamyl-Q tRNA(Asp) synthetase